MEKTTQILEEEFKLDPPTIYESQLFPNGEESLEDISNLNLNESNIGQYSGPKGSGKTASLCYVGCLGMAGEMPVWSNFPIEFYLIRDVTGTGLYKDREHYKATLLTIRDLLSRKIVVKGGLILLSEYGDIASAYAFNTTKNRYLNAMWAQIRKLGLSFYYDAKLYRWVDTRTRDELDVEFACMDAHFTPWGRQEYPKGEKIFWQMKDWSGKLTGYQYETHPIEYPFSFYMKPFRGAYPTNFRYPPEELFRGLEMDLEKDVITDKDGKPTFNIDTNALCQAAQKLFDQQQKWVPADFWYELKIFNKEDKLEAKRILRNQLGLLEKDPTHPVFEQQTRIEVNKFSDNGAILAGVN